MTSKPRTLPMWLRVARAGSYIPLMPFIGNYFALSLSLYVMYIYIYTHMYVSIYVYTHIVHGTLQSQKPWGSKQPKVGILYTFEPKVGILDITWIRREIMAHIGWVFWALCVGPAAPRPTSCEPLGGPGLHRGLSASLGPAVAPGSYKILCHINKRITYVYICVYICTHICIVYIHMCLYTYICMYVCMYFSYTYVYIYIHTAIVSKSFWKISHRVHAGL